MTHHPVLTLLLSGCLTVAVQNAAGQGAIRGKVLNSRNEPATNASVLLLKCPDSLLIASLFCNHLGDFLFEKIDTGHYILLTSMAGRQQRYSPLFKLDSNRELLLETQVLEAAFTELKEVSVTAKKPFLEQEPYRLILNIAVIPSAASSTALQILERSPGVLVNRQSSSISLLGKEGVNILINGKPAYMPAAAIFQMLDGMNAGNIETIEIITTPSASMDAEGKAGYVNIVLKKNEFAGTNGSFYLTGGYSRGPLAQAGLNFNHRSGRLNFFGNLSWTIEKKPIDINTYVKVSNNGDVYETWNSMDRNEHTQTHSLRLGMDYQLAKRTVMGVLVTSTGRWYSQKEKTYADFYLNSAPDTLARSWNREKNYWVSYGINLNLQQQLGKGDQLNFNADYLRYKNDQPFHYYTRYLNPSGDLIYDESYRNGKLTPMNIWVLALDYLKKISAKLEMELGVKETIANFTNDLKFERLQPAGWEVDPELTSIYYLKEDYSMAYASFRLKASGKLTVKAGLRYEYTNSNLETKLVSNIVDRHYGRFFPVVQLNYRTDENHSFSLAYNSRIARPAFNDLAPFTYYMNRNSMLTGNPALQPTITHGLNASYSFKQYMVQLSFTKEINGIAAFQPSVDSVLNKVVSKAENLDDQYTLAASVSVPLRATSWWNMQYNLTGTWTQINAVYQKNAVRQERAAFNVFSVQSFTLPKQISLEITGYYSSKIADGVRILKPLGKLDIGLRKKIGLRDNLNLSGTNLLNTMRIRVYSDFPEFNLVGNVERVFLWPAFALTWTHNFGKEKLHAYRNRLTGAEEEKGRVQY